MNAQGASTPLQLVQASLADVPKLAALEALAHASGWSERQLHDAVQAGWPVFALRDAQQWWAHAVVMPGVQEAHLLNVAVHPQRRRQGLATLLLAHVEQWAQLQDAQGLCGGRCEGLWLEVRTSNHAARTLYEGLGYTWVAERKHYYPAPTAGQPREHAQLYCKRFAPHATVKTGAEQSASAKASVGADSGERAHPPEVPRNTGPQGCLNAMP